jgi:hypothetical protein
MTSDRPELADEELTAQLADMLVRCGIERGQLGRIDADNVALILLPIVRRYGDQRAAEAEPAIGRVLALADSWDTDEDARYSHNRIARQTAARAVRAAACRGEADRDE